MDRYKQVTDALLNILGSNPDSMSIAELAEKTHVHRNVVANTLVMLQAQGKVEIVKKGAKRFVSLSNRIPLRFITELTSLPLLIFDRRLNIIEMNPAAQTFYPGCESVFKAEQRARFKERFLNPEITSSVQEAVKGSRIYKTMDIEWDGHPKSCNLTLIPIVLENSSAGAALIIEDLTEKRELETRYHTIQQEYDTILTDQIQFIVRFRTDFSIIFANDVYCNHREVEENALIGSSFIPSFPEETYRSVLSQIEKINTDHPMTELMIRRISPGGEFSWERWRVRGLYDEFSMVTQYHAVGLDITEDKRTEQELNHYKSHLESIISERTLELRQINGDLHKEITRREAIERELNQYRSQLEMLVRERTENLEREITTRIRIEESLRQSEHILHDAQHLAHVGSWVLDIHTGKVTLSAEMCRIYGLDPENDGYSFSNLEHTQFIHPDYRERFEDAIRNAAETGEPYKLELKVIPRDGVTRIILSRGEIKRDALGEPIQLLDTSQDITQLKRTQRDLRKSELTLSTLLESIPDMIWSVDIDKFRLQIFNSAFSIRISECRGITIQSGMTPDEMFLPDDALEWEWLYERLLLSGPFQIKYDMDGPAPASFSLSFTQLLWEGKIFGILIYGKKLENIR
ncbi:MAG TPA: PAS domain S-box protein [Methanospirillum sp.]|nr:PAS domain S-box protein [Methanospirillum sp.]